MGDDTQYAGDTQSAEGWYQSYLETHKRWRKAEDELSALKEENARLREALEPFAFHGDTFKDLPDDAPWRPVRDPTSTPHWGVSPTMGDLRRARQELKGKSDAT